MPRVSNSKSHAEWSRPSPCRGEGRDHKVLRQPARDAPCFSLQVFTVPVTTAATSTRQLERVRLRERLLVLPDRERLRLVAVLLRLVLLRDVVRLRVPLARRCPL